MALSAEVESKTCKEVALPVYVVAGLAVELVGKNVRIDFEVEVNDL